MDIPERLLVVGGGFVGLEIGSVYASLGSKVVLVENDGQLMHGIDSDLAKPLVARLRTLYESIHFNTKVASLDEDESGVNVNFDGEIDKKRQRFDRVLAAVREDAKFTGNRHREHKGQGGRARVHCS